MRCILPLPQPAAVLAAVGLAVSTGLCASLGIAATTVRGNLIFDGIPDDAAGSADSLDAYLSTREARPLGFTPKGELLIATRFGDVDQLHLVSHPGADRRQITFLREPITSAAFSPDPFRNAFFFLKDEDGEGRAQLYYQHMGDLEARRITDGKSSNGRALWSNSGREIAFFTTARDGVSYDIDIVEPESGALPHLALSGDEALSYPLDFSPDDRKLLVERHVSFAEDTLYVVDLGTGEKREVDPSPSKGRIVGAKFSRDGQGVYLISDRDSEFARLRYVNLFTADRAELSAHLGWDVEELALSRDGHYLAFTSNEAGASKLNVVDLRSHQDLIPPRLPVAGVIDSLAFDPESKRLFFGYAAPDRPRDAYALEIDTSRLEEWTSSEAGPLDRTKLAVPHLAQFPTFDRTDGQSRQIPFYSYAPATPGAHPVLIVLSDGPNAQFRPRFDPWIQYLVNELGFAVLGPNVRGSSGYGKSYRALGRGLQREDAVKDVGALLVWLGRQSELDTKHVAVCGDAYGGYLALAALAYYGDRLRAGVDFAGMTDFIGYLGRLTAGRQIEGREELGDERDPDTRAFLRRISALTNADRINRPLLIVHGKNDALVPIGESQQLANRMRSRGGTVWFLEATDEGHEFTKWPNRVAYYQTFARFLTAF